MRLRQLSKSFFQRRRGLRSARRGWRIAALVLVAAAAGAGVLALSQRLRGPAPQKQATAAATPVVLPLEPKDWRGEIDYRALDSRIQAMMTDRSMTGLAIAVVEDGRLAFVKGYGAATPGGDEKIDADTIFRWASLSKTVASTLSARLAANGAFSLDDPLGKFGVSLRLPGGAEQTLTIEQLLSQRTGLPRNAYDGWLEGGREPRMIRESLGTVAPQCPPATCHTYQNLAFDTVSEVVQAATHKPFDEEVRQTLFLPLGMTSATYGMAGLNGAEHWARPTRSGRLLPLAEAYYRVPAAAGVNSNIVDLARWMQAQMGLAPAVLPASVLSEIQRPRVGTGRPYGNSPLGRTLEKPAYGLAMRSFGYQGHRLAGHSGAVDGYRSTMMFDPARKTGVVMLWNSESSLPFRLQAEVMDLYYHLPFTDWMELKQGEDREAAAIMP